MTSYLFPKRTSSTRIPVICGNGRSGKTNLRKHGIQPASTVQTKSRAPVRTVLKQHGYNLIGLIQSRKDINIYHAEKDKCDKVYKIEEYMGTSQNPASLNYHWLKHENLLPYQEHFQDCGRFYFVAKITGPNALKHIEKVEQDGSKAREEMARKLAGQLVKALKYCHKASIYLTDFEWKNTVVEDTTGKLFLMAFDGMTDVTNWGNVQLGPKWNQPPELLRSKGCLRLSVPKIETWVVGCAILELLLGRHLGKPLEEQLPRSAMTQAQAWFNIRTNLALLPFWLEGSNLSVDSKEFLLWLLAEKSHQRPSIEEVCNHPWLADIVAQDDTHNSDGTTSIQDIRPGRSYTVINPVNRHKDLVHKIYPCSRNNQNAAIKKYKSVPSPSKTIHCQKENRSPSAIVMEPLPPLQICEDTSSKMWLGIIAIPLFAILYFLTGIVL